MRTDKFVRSSIAALAVLIGLAAAGCSSSPGLAGSGDLDISICDPANGPFTVESTNEFFPMEVGTVSVLSGEEADAGTLEVVRTVLDETVDVAGVTTRVIEERESAEGDLVEISRNYFAQAPDGTICYFGEDVDTYEGGVVIGHEGAWQAGGDNLPGIQMPAAPEVGMTYDQEYAPGVAQDHGEITAMGELVSVPAGDFEDTLRVIETTPLDADQSLKIYARGVGQIVDETLELQ
jgi:hypothetical protein